jgi:hypothetical protein
MKAPGAIADFYRLAAIGSGALRSALNTTGGTRKRSSDS